ncbi:MULTISPECIES: tRNA lysidine(34) synthetase TilS [Turicibacter]|uniref:tRNA(Ile)-lysidine synthase n=1 Tax=Turicibacter faecis TaxID=2963365 RepID=A0ABM8IKV9_9FIRM|nr:MULTISPECIES: tRNA lysidine(34) synthetase TilS [unclassified Turicibacter]MCU7205398.1 tRNA lysidine(34) synthetase TilS [Turicibacter sp. TA25]MCU7209297.1 tRNA lysidine(34) synthetase TilS [Turicibacter sp. 1E2]NCE79438.1 tRNA lysidine(34) synthetase TilS [Turicibacter sp. TS3]BEH91887.1 tRNA(Ile)-lysidine synthase [Turicibacter sp. TC023]
MQKVVLETIKKYDLFDQRERVIVAVSGGADSMALLHFLKHYATNYQLSLVVAHVNHKKRKNADLDELLVQKIATNYQLPYEVYYLPPGGTTENFHEYARKERYNFFRSVAKKYGADCLVTAHHADDQLETQIQRLLYFESPNGLIGIKAKRVSQHLKVVRPLIRVTKKQIYGYCEREGVKFREDESNQSDVYTRNRIRKYIVPELVKESPSVYEHLNVIGEQLNDDEIYFSQQVDELMENTYRQGNDVWLSRRFIQQLPPSLSRRLIKRILQQFVIKDIQHIHIEKVLELIRNPKPNLTLFLPHQIRCIVAYDKVSFSKDMTSSEEYEFTLSLNDSVVLPNGDILKVSENKVDEKPEKFCINEVHLCYNEIELPLKVRTRQPGDRIQLMNGSGSKKIKEIMIEGKVPRLLRDTWPIVVDSNDKILWVPLLKKSAFCCHKSNGKTMTIVYKHRGGNEEDA